MIKQSHIYPSSSSCNKGTTIQHFQFELIGTDRFDLDLYVKLRKEYFQKTKYNLTVIASNIKL